MAEISLIPQRQKERSIPGFASFKGPRFKFKKFSKIVTALLILLIAITIILFTWADSLDSQKRSLQEELRDTISQRDASLEKKLNQTSVLLASFGGLLKDHRNWSELFKIVEARTIEEINYTSFDGDYEMGTFSLEGISTNYNTLARQIKSFEQAEGIDEVNVSSIKLNKEGEVTFTALIFLKR